MTGIIRQTRREMLRASVAGVAAAAGVGGLLTGGDVAGAVTAPAPIREPERRLWRLEYEDEFSDPRYTDFEEVSWWSAPSGTDAVLTAWKSMYAAPVMLWIRQPQGQDSRLFFLATGDCPEDRVVECLRVTEVPPDEDVFVEDWQSGTVRTQTAREWAAEVSGMVCYRD